MRIEPQLTDVTVLTELGERLRGLRLSRDITQQRLGEEAGVARTVVQRIEAGEPVTTANLIRVLRALDLLEALDRLIPQSAPSPVQELRLRGRQRRRASGAHGAQGGAAEPTDQARPWRWGDES
jgi:transcriptional regulator with XRE-family HTH domain